MENDKRTLHIQNLLKALRRASWEKFLGSEALAFADAYHWLKDELDSIEKLQAEVPKSGVSLTGSPIPAPLPVSQPAPTPPSDAAQPKSKPVSRGQPRRLK